MSVPQEVSNLYNRLKGEYSEIFKRYIELQDERRENTLVLDNLEPLTGERKCWKILGGVLVEHTIGDTKKSLKDNVTMLESTLRALDSEMAKRQREVLQLQLKHGLSPNRKQE